MSTLYIIFGSRNINLDILDRSVVGLMYIIETVEHLDIWADECECDLFE